MNMIYRRLSTARIVFFPLFFWMLLAVPSHGFAASEAEEIFCKVNKYADTNAILTTIGAVGLSIKLVKSGLKTWAFLEGERIKASRATVTRDLLTNKELIRVIGIWKPLRFFTKTLIPFMVKHRKLLDDLDKVIPKVRGSRKTVAQRIKNYYKIVNIVRNTWTGVVAIPLTVITGVAIPICKQGKILVFRICLKKKQKCDAAGIDTEDLLFDTDTGQVVGSYGAYSCRSRDAKRARSLLRYARSQKATIDRTVAGFQQVNVFLRKYAPHAKKFNRIARPVVMPAAKAANLLKKLNQITAPAYKALGKLNKVMKKKICFSYPVKRKGKTRIKKKCTKVKNAIRDIGKMAKVMQKPLEIVLKATIDPIIKKIAKKVPGVPGLGKFKKFFRAFTPQRIKVFTKMQAELDRFKGLRLDTYQKTFKKMNKKLKKWKK